MGKTEELGSGQGTTDSLLLQGPSEGTVSHHRKEDSTPSTQETWEGEGGEAMGVEDKKLRKGETEAQRREPEGHPGGAGRAERAG